MHEIIILMIAVFLSFVVLFSMAMALAIAIFVGLFLFISFWKIWLVASIIIFLVVAGKYAKKSATLSY